MALRKSSNPQTIGDSRPYALVPSGATYQRVCPELAWRHPPKRSDNRFGRLEKELEVPNTRLCLASVNFRNIPLLVQRKLLKPLTNVISASELKTYFQPVLDVCSSQGILYSLPEDFSPYVMVVQKDVLKKHSLSPPKTWRDLAQQAKILSQKSKCPVIATLGGKRNSHIGFLTALLCSNGLNSEMEAELDEEICMEAYEWLQQITKEELFDSTTLDSTSCRTEDFFDYGKWVYRFCWLSELRRESPEFWEKVEIVPFPAGTSTRKSVTLIHGHAWIIPANTMAAEVGINALRRITATEVVLTEEVKTGAGYPFHAKQSIWKNPLILEKCPAYRHASAFSSMGTYSISYGGKSIQLLASRLLRSLERDESSREWFSKISRKLTKDVHQIVKKAVSYMQSHLKENLTVSSVAKALGKSRRHLNRLFQQEMHVTASDYLKNLKMEQAHKLLTTTSLSIKEVASQTGFDYLGAFGRAFKRHWGQLPSAVQRKAAKSKV